MPSRVTVIACTALLVLACACAVRAALPSPTSDPYDLLGTDWSQVDFTTREKGPVTVTVKTGAVLYHTSDSPVDINKKPPLKVEGFWLTPDLSQSVAAGMTKEFGKVGVFVHSYSPRRDLKLLALPACANVGLAYLNSVVASKGVPPWKVPLMGNPSQFGLHLWLAKVCPALASMGIDGWRSPWDQDEIMLCIAHQKELIPDQVRGCSAHVLGKNVPTRTPWNPVTRTPQRFESQVKAFPPGACGTAKDLFSFESPIRWANDLGAANGHVESWQNKWWETLELKAAVLEVANPKEHVRNLVNRYRGQPVDEISYLWFCGSAKQEVKQEIKKEI